MQYNSFIKGKAKVQKLAGNVQVQGKVKNGARVQAMYCQRTVGKAKLEQPENK